MERYKVTSKRDILIVKSEPHMITHYRGYGLAVIVRNLSTNEEFILVIDGIKSLFTQLEPLVESNGGMFIGLKFGIKKFSDERSSPYVIDTQISETRAEIAADEPTSQEEKLWRTISNRYRGSVSRGR